MKHFPRVLQPVFHYGVTEWWISCGLFQVQVNIPRKRGIDSGHAKVSDQFRIPEYIAKYSIDLELSFAMIVSLFCIRLILSV